MRNVVLVLAVFFLVQCAGSPAHIGDGPDIGGRPPFDSNHFLTLQGVGAFPYNTSFYCRKWEQLAVDYSVQPAVYTLKIINYYRIDNDAVRHVLEESNYHVFDYYSTKNPFKNCYLKVDGVTYIKDEQPGVESKKDKGGQAAGVEKLR